VRQLSPAITFASQHSIGGIEAVRRLFAQAQTPQHIALRWFVLREFSRLSAVQKQWAVAHLVQHARTPGNDAIFTAFSFFKLMPDAEALGRLWERWVSEGRFDFDGNETHLDMGAMYIRLMNEAVRDDLHQFDHCMKLFRNRLRGLARGREISEVVAAADILYEAQKQEYVRLGELCEELAAAPYTSEWKQLALPEAVSRAFVELVTAIQQGTAAIDSWVRFREVVRPHRRSPTL
jgi:hypothetical protein